MKEINLKIEKVGVVHFFALVCNDELPSKVCGDCGKTVSHYSKVMWSKRDLKTNSLIWKVVCDDCLENYKTKELDQTSTIKLGKFNGNPIGKITKLYKPYLQKCKECKNEFDLYKTPLYTYGIGLEFGFFVSIVYINYIKLTTDQNFQILVNITLE